MRPRANIRAIPRSPIQSASLPSKGNNSVRGLPNVGGRCTCVFCGSVFQRRKELKRHFQSCRGKENESPVEYTSNAGFPADLKCVYDKQHFEDSRKHLNWTSTDDKQKSVVYKEINFGPTVRCSDPSTQVDITCVNEKYVPHGVLEQNCISIKHFGDARKRTNLTSVNKENVSEGPYKENFDPTKCIGDPVCRVDNTTVNDQQIFVNGQNVNINSQEKNFAEFECPIYRFARRSKSNSLSHISENSVSKAEVKYKNKETSDTFKRNTQPIGKIAIETPNICKGDKLGQPSKPISEVCSKSMVKRANSNRSTAITAMQVTARVEPDYSDRVSKELNKLSESAKKCEDTNHDSNEDIPNKGLQEHGIAEVNRNHSRAQMDEVIYTKSMLEQDGSDTTRQTYDFKFETENHATIFNPWNSSSSSSGSISNIIHNKSNNGDNIFPDQDPQHHHRYRRNRQTDAESPTSRPHLKRCRNFVSSYPPNKRRFLAISEEENVPEGKHRHQYCDIPKTSDVTTDPISAPISMQPAFHRNDTVTTEITENTRNRNSYSQPISTNVYFKLNSKPTDNVGNKPKATGANSFRYKPLITMQAIKEQNEPFVVDIAKQQLADIPDEDLDRQTSVKQMPSYHISWLDNEMKVDTQKSGSHNRGGRDVHNIVKQVKGSICRNAEDLQRQFCLFDKVRGVDFVGEPKEGKTLLLKKATEQPPAQGSDAGVLDGFGDNGEKQRIYVNDIINGMREKLLSLQ